MLKTITILDLLSPCIDAIAFAIWLIAAIILFRSIGRRRCLPLQIIAIGCVVTSIANFICLPMDIHLRWHITLVPVILRRTLYFVNRLIACVEVILYPPAFILLAKQNSEKATDSEANHVT